MEQRSSLSSAAARSADDGQLALGVADTQNPVDNTVADDDPVHIPSRALDTDVVQSGEALAAEKINSA